MLTVTIQEAQAALPDLIHQLMPGDELLITENHQPVARLVSQQLKQTHGFRPPPGLGKGFITIISEDEEHRKDFAEYMPRGSCLLVAQVLIEAIPIVSNDPLLDTYGITRLW